jgi:EmrB/QacA subfamily drug resistance transporter
MRKAAAGRFHRRVFREAHSLAAASGLYQPPMQEDFADSGETGHSGESVRPAPGDASSALSRGQSAAGAPSDTRAFNRIVPIVLAVALFMENMDSTVISTSLPAIATDIGTTAIALKLALTAYLVSLAIFIPISGWMADRFGARNIFRIAIGVFVIGSLACAASGSLGEIVAARFLQGMGGAMMTPVGRLVLVRTTPKWELVSAMAWLSIPALIGPMMGPPVGGFITTYFSWHWIFLINLPIGILGIVAASLVLPRVPGSRGAPIDLVGFVLSAVAASGVVFGLSVVSLPALPPIVGVLTLAAGCLSIALYIWHARRTPYPLLNPKLFANPVFRAAIVGGAIFRIGAGAVPFLLPLMLQVGFGLSPFHSGLLTFVSAMGAFAMKFVAKPVLRAAGFRSVLIFASVAGAIFIGVNGLFTAATPHSVIILILFVAGFLRSIFFTSSNALVFAEIGDVEASQATAIAAVAQQTSIALGVAIAGGVLEGVTWLSGRPLEASTFSVTFFIVAAMAACAFLPFLGIAPTAGSAVSGHGGKRVRLGFRVRGPVRIGR